MTYKDKAETARYLAKAFLSLENGTEAPRKSEDISWSWVYGMAKRHSISVLIFSVLEKYIKAEAPEELYRDWQKDVALSGAKYISQKTEFSLISRLFSENKVPFLHLKGFCVKALYSAPELREMTDIDIFVPPSHFDRAEELILSLGYSLSSKLEVHDSFVKPPFLEIELHKIIHKDMRDYSLSGAVRKDESSYAYEMTDEDFVIFLLHHAKKHDTTGGVGIRCVFDFYLVFKKISLDAEKFEKRLRKENLFEFYKKLKALINFWFFDAPLDEATLEFEIYTVTGGTFGNAENEYLKAVSEKGKGHVISRIFPPFSFMKSAFPVLKKCPLLLPIFYVWRIVKSLFNGSLFRNFKALRGAGKKARALREYKNETERDSK